MFLAIIDQGPLPRAFRNFLVTGNAWGLFHRNSHINQTNNTPKVAYSTKDKALKAAASMQKKYGHHYSVYKCCFCDGFHIGKNRDASTSKPQNT